MDPWFSVHHRASHADRVVSGFSHENPGYELSFVEAGELAFTLGTGERRVVAASAGAAILLPPGLLNTPRMRFTRVAQIVVSHALVTEAVDALGTGGAMPDEPFVHGVDSSVSAIARAIGAELPHARGDDPGIEALVSALVLALVRRRDARGLERERVIEPAIRRALDYLEAHWSHPIGVDDLARAAGLSRFVFLRKFKAQIGESPYRHLVGVRLDRAAERLRSTRDSVLAIALDCGFGDPSRFARAFARRFGESPLRWRATNA
jgi:AraC-like DNA-binding protein